MTNEEAKKAFMEQVPVVWQGIEYVKITAIIYRLDKYGKVMVLGEMLDRCLHSVVTADVKNIELKEQKK